MSDFNFGNLAQALSETVNYNGVRFVAKGKLLGTEENASELIAAIDACECLEFLDLEGNTLGVCAANAIGKALERHPEFQQALWKDLFTGRLKTEIPEALESMGRGIIAAGAQLSILDCSDNALGPNGMRGLVDLLKSPACYSLTELKLNNCGLGIEGGRMLAKSLIDCYLSGAADGRPFQLRVFIAGRNRLENDGARALAEVFGRLGTLVEVAMPQNGINPDGIEALAEAFKRNAGLRCLNLNDNTITPRGASSLADAIEVLQELREINLGDCLLKSKGVVLLAEAIQDGHEQLEVLNLGFNEIGPNGGMAVAGAMQNKENIRELVLNGNMFGRECRECIAEILRDVGKFDALGALDEDDSDNEDVEDDVDGDEDYEDVDDEEEGEYDEDRAYVESETEEADDEDCDIAKHAAAGGAENQSTSFSFSANSTLPMEKTPVPATRVPRHGGILNSYMETEIVKGSSPVETFCLTRHPTAEMFNDVKGADPAVAFRRYLCDVLTNEKYLLYVVFAVLKCAALSSLCPKALGVSCELLRDSFQFAAKTAQMQRVMTFFLTQLGLIRIEDPTFRPAYDVKACRAAVRHAIDEGYLTDPVSDAFEVFFSRPV